MIDGPSFLDQLVNNGVRAYQNLRKSVTGNGDDYTNGCLLHYTYFKEYMK